MRNYRVCGQVDFPAIVSIMQNGMIVSYISTDPGLYEIIFNLIKPEPVTVICQNFKTGRMFVSNDINPIATLQKTNVESTVFQRLFYSEKLQQQISVSVLNSNDGMRSITQYSKSSNIGEINDILQWIKTETTHDIHDEILQEMLPRKKNKLESPSFKVKHNS